MKNLKRLEITLFASLVLWGCAGLIVDPSISAVEAGDATLAMSACEATPAGGMDICRVTEGTTIQSSWKLIIPTGRQVVGWEVDAYYRDVAQAVHVEGKAPVIEIPWADFFKSKTWDKSMNGEVQALVSVTFKEATGLTQIVKFIGFAKIRVLSPGYSRLPIDSGAVAWKTTCKVQYSTKGRSAVECK